MDDNQFNDYISDLGSIIHMDPNLSERQSLKEALQHAFFRREGVSAFASADTLDFLLDGLATIGYNCHYSIDVAWGEGTPNARLDESVRSFARFLGVRQRRKSPASFRATFTRADPPYTGLLNIPAFTQFTCNGEKYFNREPLVFESGDGEETITLYQGEIKRLNFLGTNDDYPRVAIDEPAFVVSDDDVYVTINNVTMQTEKTPIWHHPNVFDKATGAQTVQLNKVADFTGADGKATITFGSRIFAYKLKPADQVRITYAVTNGTLGRSFATLGLEVGINDEFIEADIAGIGITIMSGGGDEIPTSVYRHISPLLFSAQSRAIDSNGYNVVPLEYPGVKDALVVRQSQYAPEDERFATIMKVSLLMETPVTTQIWDDFVAWLSKRGLAIGKYLRDDPIPYIVNVDATIYIDNAADASLIQTRSMIGLEKLFEPRFGLLGMKLAETDFTNIFMTSAPGVNYANLHSNGDIETIAAPPPTVDFTVTEGAGTLAVGNYQYYITTTTTVGETLGKLFMDENDLTPFIVNPNGRVTLTWENANFGTGYKIYRKFNNVVKLIATINDRTVEAFIDNGVAGTNAEIPLRDTSGVYYPKLGTVNLDIRQSNRIRIGN